MKYTCRKIFRFLLCGCFPWFQNWLFKTNARWRIGIAERSVRKLLGRQMWFRFSFPLAFFLRQGQVCIIVQSCALLEKVLLTCCRFQEEKTMTIMQNLGLFTEHIFLLQKTSFSNFEASIISVCFLRISSCETGFSSELVYWWLILLD